MTTPAVIPSSSCRTAVRFGLWTASAVAAYAALATGVLRPLHAAGWCQSLIDYLNGLGDLLQYPGGLIFRRGSARLGDPALAPPWLVALALNAGFYFVVGFLVRLAWCGTVRRRRAPAAPPQSVGEEPAPPERVSRRGFLAGGLQMVGGGAVAVAGYGLVVEPRRLDVSHNVFYLRDLPPSLDGLRAVQLTDIHHGPWFSLARVRELVETANEQRPDLVLLTGDYVHLSDVYIAPVAAELARLRPRIATVAVLGNHDWSQGAARTREELARWGIPVLDNDRRVLTPERRLEAEAAQGLALCGVGDLLKDRPDYRRALAGLPEDMPRVLLSHNPDVAEKQGLTRSGLRVDLIVSGHTHGGQIKLPFVGAPISGSWYGEKYRAGLAQGPVCPVFVCRGIGVVGIPIRLGVTPEMAVLEFRVATLDA